MVQDVALTKDIGVQASTPLSCTVRLLETLAVARKWSIATADVSVAFLHAEAKDVMIVKAPKEWIDKDIAERRAKATTDGDDPDQVRPRRYWQLRRELYGRRGAPQAWQRHLADILTTHVGMHRSTLDATVFYDRRRQVYMCWHVDDCLCVGDDVAN